MLHATRAPLTARELRWMQRVDGCPECVYNAEPPLRVEFTGDVPWFADTERRTA